MFYETCFFISCGSVRVEFVPPVAINLNSQKSIDRENNKVEVLQNISYSIKYLLQKICVVMKL